MPVGVKNACSPVVCGCSHQAHAGGLLAKFSITIAGLIGDILGAWSVLPQPGVATGATTGMGCAADFQEHEQTSSAANPAQQPQQPSVLDPLQQPLNPLNMYIFLGDDCVQSLQLLLVHFNLLRDVGISIHWWW